MIWIVLMSYMRVTVQHCLAFDRLSCEFGKYFAQINESGREWGGRLLKGAQLKLPVSGKCPHDIQKSSQNRMKSWKGFCWHVSDSVDTWGERGWNWKIIGNKRLGSSTQHSSRSYLADVAQPVTFIVGPHRKTYFLTILFNDAFHWYFSLTLFNNAFHSYFSMILFNDAFQWCFSRML